jgi:glycosyltransferase involved in cell wall biosynthesis
MKIGIDLRRLVSDAADPLTSWLRGPLAALLAHDTANTYVLFHTPFNYYLFPADGSNVVRHTLATTRFVEELQDRIAFEGDYDLVFRCALDGPFNRFPLERQIVCVPAYPLIEGPPNSDGARALLKVFRAFATCGGALAVPNETARSAVTADPWCADADVFVLHPDPQTAPEVLLSAFARVAQRAAGSVLRVRVNTPPVVSIVTPSFNQGSFIRETIDSVLSQDYPHLDYQVIDGGSTDDTLAVLKSYGDRVKWVSEKDRGQADAINKGMAEARGEIRAYLNSDDLLRPGAVSRVVEHFRARPACDLVYGRDALIDARGTYLGMYPTAEYSFEALADCCCISQPAAFWRARLAKAIGPFDESLHLVMDYEYWLRADRAGCVLEHVPDVLAHTRIHRQAKSGGSGSAEAHHRRYYRELFDVSFRHAGYVSSRYVFNWLYTAVFNARPWTRRYEDLITRVVQQWFHTRYRCGLSRYATIRLILETEQWFVWPYLRRRLAPLKPRNWFRAAPAVRVELEPDLWLGPELTFPHAGGPVRLTGVPACNGVLRVYHGTDEIASRTLRADEPTDVCVDVPGPGPVRITFSDSEPLPDGRRAAFKLHGTTLFGEKDAA